MKNRIVWLLLALALLLGGCTGANAQPKLEHPFRFYYAAKNISYGTAEGVLAAQEREFDDKTQSVEELVDCFFEGPTDTSLVMPFPEGTKPIRVYRDAASVVLTMNKEYLRLTGIDRSVADACLAKTLLGYEGIERVTVKASDGTQTMLTRKNLILQDNGARVQDTSVTLYFADAENRFLIAEQRSTDPLEETQIPEYIVQQLIHGTAQRGYLATIPGGTKLLSARVADGVCTVDFSLEFLTNSPATHAEERMTLYSIVNSLTELENVDAVEIRVDGDSVGVYRHMSLHEPISRDETVIGPVKTASGEVDATLCVYDGKHLLRVPSRISVASGEEPAAAIVRALLTLKPYNVYVNPIPQKTELRSLSISEDICYIDLSKAFLQEMTAEELRIAVHSLVATVCCSKLAEQVCLTVEGAAPAKEYEQPIRCNEAWLAS